MPTWCISQPYFPIIVKKNTIFINYSSKVLIGMAGTSENMKGKILCLKDFILSSGDITYPSYTKIQSLRKGFDRRGWVTL